MTVRLLKPYAQRPVGAIATFDASTEAGMIEAKQASADLTGGFEYFLPRPGLKLQVQQIAVGSLSLRAAEQAPAVLPEGQVLNVSGSVGAVGKVHRLDPAGGNAPLQSWAVGATSFTTPAYAGEQRFLVTCSAGSVVATVGDAVLSAPQFATDQGQNKVGLRAPGGAIVSASPMGAPSGADWLADSIPSIDLYAMGFGKNPTLFFDPSATNSAGLGTLRNPYYTQEQLQLAIRGDMRGQVLGFKRGTMLRALGVNGLSLSVHGTADKPFIICPYGDALGLPQITGGIVRNTWTKHTSDIWKLTGLAANTDMWQNSARVNKKTSLAGLTGPGMSYYDSGATTMYLWPFDNENPNLGQIETPASQYALNLTYSDVSATGNISLAGIDVRQALNIALRVASVSGASSVTSVSGLNIVACRGGQAGYDAAGLLNASDAILLYGLSNTVRVADSMIIGCEGYDCLNNSFEVANVDGLIVDSNYGHDAGGNTVLEAWSSCSNMNVRNNYGLRSSNAGRIFTNYHCGGIWATTYNGIAGGANQSHAAFQGNLYEFNIIAESQGQCIQIDGGTGNKVYHNTLYNSAGTPTNRMLNIFANCPTPGTADADVSNNLLMCGSSNNRIMVDIVQGTVAATEAGAVALTATVTGNNNAYLGWSAPTAQLRVRTAAGVTLNGQSGLAAYKTAAAPFDAAATSNWTTPDALIGPAYRPRGSMLTGGKAGLSARRYKDGLAYDPTSCAVGAFGS